MHASYGSQQARIFCPENLCSELPPCFAFVGSRASRNAHDRSTAGGRPEVPCGPSRTSPPPLPTFRKIHVDSAALTHQPSPDLRPFCAKSYLSDGSHRMKKHKRSQTDAARRLEIVCLHYARQRTCCGSARALCANTSAGERSKAGSSVGGGDLGVQTLTLFLRTHPVIGTLLERLITGIRW